ncbi:MAG: methionyl-tRNA formyltransferase [Bacteroidetes bacterium]|nr:MAG: methionyl-tRNA formyltransferase [Bacteroidota bacterium]
MNKIVLFLLSEKGYAVLQEILTHFGAEQIDFIVLGRDSRVLNDYSNEIQKLAEEHQVKCFERTEKFELTASYALAISWRWMIPLSENTQLITLHDSLLPKYRGFAPLVNQLIQGEKQLGVTAIFASEEYDRGKILGQLHTTISYPIKIEAAIQAITPLYQQLANDLFQQLQENQSLQGTPQQEEDATYSLWRDEADYCIDWKLDASTIRRTVDALGTPYLGASSEINGRKIRILEVMEENDVEVIQRQLNYGKVIFQRDQRPVIVCGKGLIRINEAYYDDDGTSIFPLDKFRLRFT